MLPFLLYGANGYTGELIARRAVRRGVKPVLAGRNREAIERLAAELACEHRVFALDAADAVGAAAHLAGVSAVLNCAGPFAATGVPMMEACLHAGVHYLDITGEIAVIEAAAARGDRARERGITLLPAAGFDVVPSDCLAAMLATELPGATHLQLGFAAIGRMSRGTAKTALEGLADGGRARIDGKIARIPAAWKMREIPFRSGKRLAMTIPWGDVASAYYSTGIPNIEVYIAAPKRQITWMRRLRWAVPLLRLGPIKRLLRRAIEKQPPGPTEDQRRRGRSSLWGLVRDAGGREVSGTLETMEGYELTMHTALESVQRVAAGQVSPGFQTPSLAFGKDYILHFPETTFELQPPA